MTLVERRAENAENRNISPAASFGKKLPEEFGGYILRKGDVITLPSEYIFDGDDANVFTQTFGNHEAQFVLVTLTRDGVDSTINFFPSSMIKNIFQSEMVNGRVQLKLPVLRPLGTVVEYLFSFRGKGTEEKTDFHIAMEAIAGAKIKISEDTIVKTQKWTDGVALNALKDTHVYTFDFV